MLSEDEIKKSFLPFLREFYRFRYEYQPNTEQVSLDNIANEGYIADGMLRFVKPDGQAFVCTYEASSLDKTEEVKFSLNQSYFLWDCIAFGGLCAAIVYGFLYLSDASFVGSLSLAGKVGLPLGVTMIAFFLWYFFMSGWKKYRYIYAIEQFRRYFADEQWVAIGEDVFPAPTNPYFLELKDQCIYQGVGLAIVYQDQQVRLIAAPSRLGVYGGNKRMAHWLTNTKIFQSMASNVKASAAYQPPVLGVFGKLRNTLLRPVRRYVIQPAQRALGWTVQPASDAYKRFTGDYLIQKSVFFFSVLVMLTIGVVSREQQSVAEADRPSRIYLPEEKAPPPSPEIEDGFVRNDQEKAIPYGKTYTTGVQEGVPQQEEVSADYSKTPPQPPVTERGAVRDAPVEKKKNTTATATKSARSKAAEPANLCDRVKQAGGWYIQDNVFSNKENALERVQLLRTKGIQCEALNAACLGEAAWIVRLGYNQYSVAAARAKAADYAQLIAKAGVKTGKTLVKKVD